MTESSCKRRWYDEDSGNDWPCERDEGHEPPHRYTLEWSDDECALCANADDSEWDGFAPWPCEHVLEAQEATPPSPSVTDPAGTYGAVTGGNGRSPQADS